jgi:hypothetical protein
MEPLRLPGLTFETPPQAVPTTLPRMDVAAFVGFAAAGPLHVPVMVEDAGRFSDLFGGVFGEPLELAWDDERGEVRRAHLGTAVESFFANGGRRCWVVRVADETAAVRHVFPVPGLRPAGASRHPTNARARAVGTWCEELALGTTLHREPLPLREPVGGGPPAFALAVGGYRLELGVESERVRPGDLLEVVFSPRSPWLYLFVERIATAEGFSRITGAPLPGTAPPSAETPGAFWFEPSPPEADPDAEPPVALSESAGLAFAAGWLGGSPPDDRRPVVRRLRFELTAWRGTELVGRLGDLAFDRRHPRFWGTLPTDEALFRELLGRRPLRPEGTAVGGGEAEEVTVATPGSVAPAGLAAEAAEPRFPFAGPPPAEAADRYLPVAMGIGRDPAGARRPTPPFPGTRLERNGLGRFEARLFLDRHLAGLHLGSLRSEAEHRHSVLGRRLRGLHSLLPLREVSLVAVPDAGHRGWSREAPASDPPLSAPRLGPPGEPDVAGRHPLAWTGVPDATGYRLEHDGAPDFPHPATAYEGPDTSASVVLPPACPRPVVFRVRAVRHGEQGPWSNTVTARLPEADFAPCAGGPPEAPVLTLVEPPPPAAPSLAWAPSETATAELFEVLFEVEEAADAAFAGARTIHRDGGTSLALPPLLDGTRYYRVRGVAGELPGPWSNTVFTRARGRTRWTEPPAARFDDRILMALQRALLRFCAARGDLLALLSLPGHYREEDTPIHVGRLTPGGGDDAPPGGGGGAFPAVPPLTPGEAGVLCHGALHHPWLTVRSAPSGAGGARTVGPLTRVPPEGAVAGTLAALALNGGAWLAPANDPLANVLALSPPLRGESRGRLARARVNGLLQRPRGFLALSADTLSPETECRPIHVRRLLILLRKLALREGERFVFEPHSEGLRRRVRHRFERVLTDLYQRGALAGATPIEAFAVRVDEPDGRSSGAGRGRFVVELAVAPAPELAHLTVRLVAGPEQLTVEEL